MSQWELRPHEARLIEELRKLEQRANEWKLEVLGSVQHGKRVYHLRPTPYLRIEPREPLSLAVDD